ncbi:MAG TPA: GNAT family protein [Mycobacteriales bacterium]|jgi:RimJ/RimL family protein N-acetyltransferase
MELGEPVPGWTPKAPPPYTPMTGRYVTLVPLLPEHAEPLWEAAGDDVWTYLSYGPFASAAEYREWVVANAAGTDPLFYAVLVGGEPRGVISILRIDAANGSGEIGHVWYAPSIQRSRATTEVAYLVGRRLFDECGYRRYEWKCNALNAASRAAAERFGFAYEGTFRRHMVAKGRNRDTAWFAMTDAEWPAIRAEFERWLDPANFDADGRQRSRLNASSASTNAWSGSSRS